MIVLDASALLDVVLDQPDKEAILARLAQPVIAPAHQRAEIVSAVARLVRAATLSLPIAIAALDEAAALDQDLVVASAVHLRRALELQDRIRVVDGLYVALAEERRCPLLTTDHRLAESDPPCQIILASA